MVGISRQKYYRAGWKFTHKQQCATEVVTMVINVRKSLPRLGGKKLYYLLQEPLSEIGVGRDKFFDILRANHLLIVPKRCYKTTTNSKHLFRKHKNLILGNIPTSPEQIWVSDITYIGGRDNHTYLTLITDAYSKRVVGYDLSNSLDVSGCLRALKMANKGRLYPNRELIHHSDRSVQYCYDDYQKALKRFKINVSMTESYNPYANAVAERINGILKQEFCLENYRTDVKTMCKIIDESVDLYNSVRPHLSCGMLTPNQMHLQGTRKIKTYRKNTSDLQVASVKEI